MSIDGYLGCRECRKLIYLGKIVYGENVGDNYFAIAGQATSQDTQTVRAIFKMFGECIGHDIRVMKSGDPQLDELMDTEYLYIGDVAPYGITFEDYLRDWPG